MAFFNEGLGVAPANYSGANSGNVEPAANFLANGGFEFRQRTAAGAVVDVGGGALNLDRWSGGNNQGGRHSQQTSPSGGALPSGVPFSLRCSGNGVGISRKRTGQGIENAVTVGLRGKFVTFSGYIQFSAATLGTTGNVSTVVGYTNGTADAAFISTNYITGGSASITFNAGSLPTAWTFFQITLLIPATANNIACFVEASGEVLSPTSEYYELALCTLSVGSRPAPWTPFGGTWQSELSYCTRFYQKSYARGTPPGSATPANIAYNIYGNTTSGIRLFAARYSLEMRVSPSVTAYDELGASGKFSTYDSAGGVGAHGNTWTSASGFIGSAQFSLYATSAGYSIGTHYTADAEL